MDSCAWSPDGTQLASTSDDRTVRVISILPYCIQLRIATTYRGERYLLTFVYTYHPSDNISHVDIQDDSIDTVISHIDIQVDRIDMVLGYPISKSHIVIDRIL